MTDKTPGRQPNGKSLGLPVRSFLFTLDQVGEMLQVDESKLRERYVFYTNRHVGSPPKDKMRAVNIAPVGTHPQWRIAEREFVRWLRYKGFRVYDRGWTID